MKAIRVILLVVAVLCAIQASGQVSRISIPAGSPEDKALQSISSETDLTKRMALLDKFVADYSGNKDAVAFGYWQMLQTAQSMGDNEKALAFGEKAAELAPGNLDILASLCGVAEATKDYTRLVEFASRGGMAYHGIASQPKPERFSAEDWSNRVQQDQASAKQMYEYLEAASLNAISSEPNAKAKLSLIEKFTAAFPNSRFDLQISQLAMVALQQLNDPAKSVEFGERALKNNPKSVPTLLMMANALIDDPKTLGRALDYSQKAVQFSADATTPEEKLTAGVAKSTYGYALLKQEKAAAAVPELKGAVELVAGNDPVLAEALFRLGFAYAKLGRKAEAKDSLEKCMAIESGYQPLAKDLLAKVSAAGPARKR